MANRRYFLTRLIPGMALIANPTSASALSEADESWLRGLNGRHKQFFDVNVLNGGAPLGRVGNFFAAYRDAYALRETEISAIFGAHGEGLGFTLSDALWNRFELGERYRVSDPKTGHPARRNIYAGSPGSNVVTVAGLQALGVRFLACRQTIARVARELAAGGRGTESEIRATLEGGLLPGVTLVPAMVVAANRAQEQGIAYIFVA